MAAYCTICGVCGCGTTITYVNGKPYCGKHIPKTVNNSKKDDQVLTPEQQIRIYGKLNS